MVERELGAALYAPAGVGYGAVEIEKDRFERFDGDLTSLSATNNNSVYNLGYYSTRYEYLV